MKKALQLFLLSIFVVKFSLAQEHINVRNYGAKGDGKTPDTKSINQAISACRESGGGTVLFPSGTYLTGSFRLYSNINIYLDAGARILASPNLEDYDIMEGYESEGRTTSLIFAAHQENITISGRGIIDGNDNEFMAWDTLHPECCFTPSATRQGEVYQSSFPDGPSAVKLDKDNRPGALVTFIECANINIQNIQIVGAPNWCLHLACCNYAKLTGLLIKNSLLVPNASAIDISKCRNVIVSDCNLIAGDDGIAIGTCADGYCRQSAENIVVTNCNIISRSAGIRIGWSNDNIRNCSFQNLFIESNRGIGIFVRHDEIVENLIFSGIIIKTRLHTGWWGNGEPIHISQIPLGKMHGLSSEGKKPGIIRNIQFSNIIIEAEHGNVIYGHDSGTIYDIFFQNIQMTFKTSPLNERFGGNFDLRPAFSNDYGIFKHDIPALFSKNCNNLNINGFTLKMEEGLPDFVTHGIHCLDFENISLTNFSFNTSGKFQNPIIFLERGKGIITKDLNIDKRFKSIRKVDCF